jgi:hypothetical protein
MEVDRLVSGTRPAFRADPDSSDADGEREEPEAVPERMRWRPAILAAASALAVLFLAASLYIARARTGPDAGAVSTTSPMPTAAPATPVSREEPRITSWQPDLGGRSGMTAAPGEEVRFRVTAAGTSEPPRWYLNDDLAGTGEEYVYVAREAGTRDLVSVSCGRAPKPAVRVWYVDVKKPAARRP